MVCIKTDRFTNADMCALCQRSCEHAGKPCKKPVLSSTIYKGGMYPVPHDINTYRCDICGETVEETESERRGLIVFCPGCAQEMREDVAMQQLQDEDSSCR